MTEEYIIIAIDMPLINNILEATGHVYTIYMSNMILFGHVYVTVICHVCRSSCIFESICSHAYDVS